MHDEADRAVERDRADRVSLRDAAAFEVTDVHTHPAEPRGRDLVAEAARELRDERAAERERDEHRARQRQRGGQEGADRGEQREHEPAGLGVPGRVAASGGTPRPAAAADRSRRAGRPA